ncbi:Ig-like domain repeat protein [Niallia sp. Krafla_26]|uniref:Ig-like domain repeat protein n=1 Tax=Niallia sp. Krafla_26 TaxID=3064703 RepID=UPI003D1717B2
MRTKRKTRRKPKLTRFLAVVMALTLLIYNTPIWVFSSAFAETGESGLTPTGEVTTPTETEPGENSAGTENEGDVSQENPTPEESKTESGTDGESGLGNDTTSSEDTTSGADPGSDDTTQVQEVTHTITLDISESDIGKVTIGDNEYTSDEKIGVTPGSEVSIKIEPKDGYGIKTVKIGEETKEIKDIKNHIETITSISADTTIFVEFAETHSITLDQSGAGKVTIDGKELTSKSHVEVLNGKAVDVTITPDTHYEISSINIGEVANTEGFTQKISFSEDTKIKVEFVKKQYSVSLAAPSQLGEVQLKYNKKEIDLKDPVEVKAEEEIYLLITPKDGYTVDSVKATIAGKETTITDTYQTTPIVVTGDTSIDVQYKLKSYTITFNSNENGSVKSGETLISDGGTVTVNHGSDSSFTVKPETGYHVESILIDDHPIDFTPIADGSYTHTLMNVTKDQKVQVTFALNTYNVTTSVEGKGTIEVADTVDHGKTVVATITPDNNSYHVSSLKVNGANIDLITDPNFNENDDGTFTYTASNITGDTNIEVVFGEVPVLEETWKQYISISPTAGELIKTYTEGKKEIYVYSNHAELTASPLDPYNRLDLSDSGDFKGWKNSHKINESISIDRFLVNIKNGKKHQKEIKLTNSLYLLFDRKSPVVGEPQLDGPNKATVGDSKWFSGAVTISGDISNPTEKFEGIEYSTDYKVYYSKGEKTDSTVGTEVTVDKGTYSFTTVDENYQGIYSIWAVDAAGNVSEVKTVDINIDKGIPTLADGQAVTFDVINNDSWSQFFNILTFGIFFNEAIEITVKAKDDASGIKKIDLKTSVDGAVPTPVNGSFKVDGLNAEAKFILDIEAFEGTFTVDVKDNVNNSETYAVNDENSNTDPGSDGVVMIEKKAPEAKISVTPNNDNSYIKGDYYNGHVTFNIDTQDEQSGVNNVTIKINGETIEHDYSKEPERKTEQLTYSIDTSEYVKHENGSYELSIEVEDNAGNITTDGKTVFVDEDAPTLPNGDEKAVHIDTVNDQEWAKFLNFLTFGTFFNEAIEVSVKVQDDVSGIQSIGLKAFDEAGNEITEEDLIKHDPIEIGKLQTEAVFKINAEAFAGTLQVEVTDEVNNREIYDITKENSNIIGENNLVMIDTTNPEVGINVVPLNEDTFTKDDYYSGDVTLEVDVQDHEAGVNNVAIDINGTEYEYDYSKEESRQNGKITYPIRTDDSNHPINEDGSYDLTVHVTDNAGNTNSAQQKIYVDQAVPTLAEGEAVTFSMINDGPVTKALNFLTFGTFFNKAIEVTVNVEDDVAGIQSVVLHTSDEKVVPEQKDIQHDGLNAVATYTLDHEDFTGTFSVEVTDHVKNSAIYEITNANSNIVSDNNTVMFDKNNPEVGISIVPNKNVASNGGNQYNGDVTFAVEVQDTQSGVNSVTIDVNGKKYEYDYSTEDDKINTPLTYDIRTDDPANVIGADGSYVVSVNVVDNAGNTNAAEQTIFIDKTNPVITDITFSNEEENVKVDENSLHSSVELKNYGYYFKKTTKVTVKANDPKVENQFTSGVKSMTVYLKDHDNGRYFAVQEDGSLKGIAESEIGRISPLHDTKVVTFNVPAAFKGQIFAKAVDHVQNTSGFKTPDGAIVENANKHAKESLIKLEKAEAQYKDNNGLDLYAGNVNVNLTVTDTYSGISEIQWSVKAPYDTDQNQSGTVKINNDKTYAAGSDSTGWQQTKTDKNLVTEMKKTIAVTNNSNDIVVKVKMTDRAGNVSEDEMKFSIDKSAPSIAVSYDNNSADAQNADFYNGDRTATIVITERNFKPEDVDYRITNTDGVIPKLVGWSTSRNGANPDQTTHTATIRYSADGDYTFDISYHDNAGHKAAPYQTDQFTIDKTKPEIQVSYNNNEAANGNYYNQARTATISITEHNFDPSRIRVSGSASDNGQSVGFPGLSGWSRSGDVNTATIQYTEDAHYSFDIDYTDMAGNVMDDFAMQEFVVDQTAPELEITGVADQSANKGDVAPVISYSDTNFNREAVSITLTGANRGPVKLDGAYADAANGGVFTFKNFAEEKEIDDLYTLTATLVDHAGNETTETIRFSVNRFGSVYAFDETLGEIAGKYVQKERDIIVTETNVDPLNPDSISVKMTKNGTPSDLVAGTDYTVTESGGGGSWSQYTYTVNKELFAGDGKYTVALYSEDRAGNVNENIDESKKAEISFGIDKTAPVIVPINLESGEQYPVDSKVASVSINDNLVLEDAKIYLNDKEVEVQNDGETFTFGIGNSNSKQNVKIVAVDAAGNELVEEVSDFLVTTNLIARWYNNTPLFYGSIGGVGGIALLIASYLLLRNRNKNIDIVENDDQSISG